MNIFDIFKTPAAQPPQPAPESGAPTMVPVSSETIAPNGVVPNQGNTSPLDQFNKLWEDVPKPENNSSEVYTPLNPEDLSKALSKVDFSSAISQEHLQAIMQGGEGAANAFTQAMSAVAQRAMLQSTLINDKLTQQAIERAVKSTRATLPEMLREQTTQQHMAETNPVFNNPAVKPVIEATRSQLLQKYPNATSSEITKMTQDYILAMGQAFMPKPESNNSSETDWDKFLLR